MFDEIMTMRMREVRSKTEMTSSLTTAAIVVWDCGAGAGAACCAGRRCGAWADAVATAPIAPAPIAIARSTHSHRNAAIVKTLLPPPDRAKPTPLSDRCRRAGGRSRSRAVAADPRERRADLSEVFENDAEHEGDTRRHVAAADARLGQRRHERHAFVLVDRRDVRVDAGAARLRRRDPVHD